MAEFDYKNFNPEVFEAYSKLPQDLIKTELINSGVFRNRQDLLARFSAQTGANYTIEPIMADIGGTAVNYDGVASINTDSRKTYSQGKIVIGRANAWKELDFSTDITGGVDFQATAKEIAKYWDITYQEILLHVLTGIFDMSGGADGDFVTAHTLDLTQNEEGKKQITATSLNTAIQKASGDNKNIFRIVIMHSYVASKLENLQVLEYFKGNDSEGLQRDVGLAYWNGRTVLIDDNLPVENSNDYTTYILGAGAFDYCDCGAKIPFEMQRDALTSGGATTLVSRVRKLIAPRGISFAPASIPTSPSNSDLVNGANWELAKNATNTALVFPHKAIPIARIVSTEE